MTTDQQTSPLSGVRIIDLGGATAGPLAAMLLTDQGAETIRIENPSKPGAPSINAVLDRGKHCLRLDLKSRQGRDSLLQLLKDADILIENFAPGVMSALELDIESLRAANPNLITVSLPGFIEGDKAVGAAKAYEGVIAAATGQYTDIHPVRGLFGLDPVYTALPIASVYAGVHAATAAVLALLARDLGDPPARIEAPLAAAAISAMSSMYMRVEDQPKRYDTPRLPGVLRHVALPLLRHIAKSGGDVRQGKLLGIARKSYPAFMTSYCCSDGALLYVFAIDNAKLTRGLLRELDLLDRAISAGLVFVDPYLGDRDYNLSESSNLSRAWQAKLKVWIGERLATAPAQKWEARLNAAGVPCAIQRTTREWLGTEELQASGIIVPVEDPRFGTMRQPGLQVWLSDSPASMARPQSRVIGKAAPSADWMKPHRIRARPKAEASDGSRHLPLQGITVIDMCSMVAGPVAGRTLAEYGAHVIKIEPTKPNHGPRMTCWYGIDGNQGKKSALLDLKTKTGHAAFSKLVARADILLTNHMPKAMSDLGLSEEDVRIINPAMLYCRINAYNGPLGGPWAARAGYDPVLQAASGIMARYGDPGHPELHAIASCVDALTGYSAAFGVALGLYRRTEDGQGRRIDASLAAAATLIQLPFAYDYEGRDWTEPQGQLAKGEHPFYRLYPTRDGWLFLAAPDATISDLPKSFAFESTPIDADTIASALQCRLLKLSTNAAVDQLTRAGLSAAPVRDIASLVPHLLQANAKATLGLVRRSVPGLGPVISAPAGQVWWNGTVLGLLAASEKPGASTERVLSDLGVDARALVESGAAAQRISDDYLPG